MATPIFVRFSSSPPPQAAADPGGALTRLALLICPHIAVSLKKDQMLVLSSRSALATSSSSSQILNLRPRNSAINLPSQLVFQPSQPCRRHSYFQTSTSLQMTASATANAPSLSAQGILASIQAADLTIVPPFPALCAYASLLFIVAAAAWLYLRLYHPIVHPYPWKLAKTPAQRQADKRRKVVLAGSYNPPHRGHIAMLEHLSQRYGEVIAVIGMNSSKKYDVTPQQRASFVRDMIASEDSIKSNVRVEVVEGYIWRFAFREGVSIMFRGIRSWEKDGDEERYLHFLNTWGPMVFGPLRWPLPTQFLEGKPEYNHISSTLIRSICMEAKEKGHEADISALVPEEVADGVAKAYC